MKKLIFVFLILSLAMLASSCSIFKTSACDHEEVVDEAIAATCTTDGLTAGVHCSKCGEVLVQQETVNAFGHTEVIDEAVEADCDSNGLTEGKHCSVCNEVITEQQVVKAAHTFGEWVDSKRICNVCGKSEIRGASALNHNFMYDEEAGYFTCDHCDVKMLYGQLYLVVDEYATWHEAYKACAELGGYLATITSPEEQAIFESLLSTAETEMYWLGGLRTNSGWKWVTEESFSYSNWKPGQPDYAASNEWFLQIYSGACDQNIYTLGHWNDLDSAAQNHSQNTQTGLVGYICEWELEVEYCDHQLTEIRYELDPTCYASGGTSSICCFCGENVTQINDKLEHSFVTDEASGLNICEYCNAAEYNGHIYAIMSTKTDWFSAYSYCENVGGHLVTITSAEEEAFVEAYMTYLAFTGRAWLGAFYDGGNMQWVTGEEFDYANWNVNQPDCSKNQEFYIHINEDTFGKWNDVNALLSYNVFCEWE